MSKAKVSEIDCLLPNGIMITVPVNRAVSNLTQLKTELWKLAAKQPLYEELTAPEDYGMRTVSSDGDVIELEEIQTIKKMNWFQPILKIWKRKGDRATQQANQAIGRLIGFADLGDIENEEIVAFRRKALDICQAAVVKRREGGRRALENYAYPPAVDLTPLPPLLKEALGPTKKRLMVKLTNQTGLPALKAAATTVEADVQKGATDLISQALKKAPGTKTEDFVLKVPGYDEFFIPGARYRLQDYTHVRRFLAKIKDGMVEPMDLILKKRSMIELHEGDVAMENRLLERVAVHEAVPKGMIENLWFSPSCKEKSFKIKVLLTDGLDRHPAIGKLFGIGIHAGVFLGDRQLGDRKQTRYQQVSTVAASGGRLEWNDDLEFDIKLADLPREAKLCLAIVGVWINPLKAQKKKKKFRNEQPLGWLNISVLDHRFYLREGKFELPTWSFDADDDDEQGASSVLNVLGTTSPKAGEDSDTGEYRPPGIAFEFPGHGSTRLHYPRADTIGGKNDGRVPSSPSGPAEAKKLAKVNEVVRKDPLYSLTEEDRDLLRTYKYWVKDVPTALPKCLQAVDWATKESAHEVVDMLRLWRPLGIEDALGLLDCGFADAATRSHAVQRLNAELGDDNDRLCELLLQLVQVLKYETFFDCDLAWFLLERAVQSQRVGHFFFWYLKAEMHQPDVRVRYGLLLEAYCRGCSGHMIELQKQVQAMDALVHMANSIKPKDIKKKEKVKSIQRQLSTTDLGVFQLPYQPAVRLGHCDCPRVMDSKKLPLWLDFDNVDGKDLGKEMVIFKAGDDLRQDMLTLQLIRIMDQLWHRKGLDYRMNAYECLSTGDEVGMLQVVGNSKTIAGIQGGKMAAFKEDPLFKWIQKENPEEGGYLDTAVENFLMSCAGYCVATYVLGIGDRHNDNIMCTKDGKLFHIDFGHFLGNWKSKFGIKRERVKFILTPDFVYALTKGEGKDSPRFRRFKKQCVTAYLIVREKANMFINLLNMMLSTGIPELKSHDDVAYLRNTLCLDMSEEDAAASFDAEIDKALKNSWSVQVNWAAHIMAH